MASPTAASSSTPPKPPNAAMLQPAPYLPDVVDSATAAPNSNSNSNSSVSSASSSSAASVAGRSSTFSVESSAATPTSSPPRPHRAGDLAWAPIRAAAAPLGPRDFTLVRRVGAGDIGTVYLCRLQAEGDQSCAYAMKVVDRRALAKKGKLGRAAAEKRVLRRLDHPFLPTMFADFDAGTDYSCIVMEFCPGGDLHSLRHRMPGRRFPLASARFYAAEVLLALEYLHMMGIVYRDLKPENVLIRGDGHIMLTDFDLSLESTASPALEEARNVAGGDDDDDATALIPTCFPEVHLLRLMKWRRRAAPRPRPRFVAEPVDARSSSFVGTHEYVAPEVASGGGHGASVDWWAYGVFLYELLYGRTPFVGATNEATLRNIVRAPLECPALSPATASHGDSAAARDLIARLLDKDPRARLGSRRGAADVKAHPFFKGLNFALLRSSVPPVVPPRAALHQQCGKASPDVQQLFDQF